MNFRFLLLGLLFLSASSAAQVPERVPVLAELFTSEGCNSCPPADKILEMLSEEQPVDGVYVVGLSEHVTYWDRLGWKDPFGSTRFTDRQNMYAFRFNLDGSFTPQLVIDGSAQMIGSDTDQIRNALVSASRTPKAPLTVAASVADREVTASASGPGLEAGTVERAELLWAITEDHITVDVKRGENANRTLRHSGVVRAWTVQKIESAKAMRTVMRIQPEWKRADLRIVAFVQSTKSKRVLSVGWAGLAAAP